MMKRIYVKEITKYFSNSHNGRFTSETLKKLKEIRELEKEKSSEERREICLNDVS